MGPIEATFEHGVFRPVTPVLLPDGCRVEISVVNQDATVSVAPATENGGGSIEDQLRRIAGEAPAEAWQRLPADLSDRIDHYVYQREVE
jgi:predicted DNA-binding antitoxin AbrB/MazE fold protein